MHPISKKSLFLVCPDYFPFLKPFQGKSSITSWRFTSGVQRRGWSSIAWCHPWLSGKGRANQGQEELRWSRTQGPLTWRGHRQQRCCWSMSEARRSHFCKPQQAQEFKSLPRNPCHAYLALPWRQGQPELNRDEIIRQNTSCKIIKVHLISEAHNVTITATSA